MKIYIDNTGLGLAGSVLLKNPNSTINDIEALINLCSLIIFSDELKVNGYDIDSTIELTENTIDQLRLQGVKNDILSYCNKKSNSIEKACDIVAENLSNNLPFEFNPNDREIKEILDGTTSRALSFERMSRQTEFIKFLDIPHDERIALTQNSINEEGMYGVVNYIFKNDNFFNAYKNLINKYPNLKNDVCKLYQLNVLIRYRVNEELANGYGLNYSPSLQRARLIKDIVFIPNNSLSLNFIEKINDSLSKIYIEISKRNQSIIPITRYLLEKSRLNPKKLIEVALELRELAKPLRKSLAKISKIDSKKQNEQNLLLYRELNVLSEELRNKLKLNNKSSFTNTISFKMSNIYNPDFTLVLDNEGLNNWIVSLFNKQQKLNVLTEIVGGVLNLSNYSEKQLMNAMLNKNI